MEPPHFLLYILVAYFKNFPKHYNKIFFFSICRVVRFESCDTADISIIRDTTWRMHGQIYISFACVHACVRACVRKRRYLKIIKYFIEIHILLKMFEDMSTLLDT